MLAVKFSAIFLFAGFVGCQQVEPDERPYLRILAPQFICNDKRVNQTEQSNVTVGLQTREGQKLRYTILVDFEMLDGFKSQRHTLSIWKNMRMLQKKFHNISDDISLKNQIDITAQELTPEVVYTFKIVGYDEQNRSSEVQNFTITYKRGELKALQPDLGDGVSLLLFISEFIYDDMPFIAVAEVSFCDPTNDFSFRWQITGIDVADIEEVSGDSLKLPRGFLQAGKFVEVSVVVLNNESLAMAKTTSHVKILAKDFVVQNAPSECLVGVTQEIPFQVLIARHPNVEAELVRWECANDKVDCSEALSNTSGLSQRATFSADGNYVLRSKVSFNGVLKSSISKVQVDSRVIPHVQIKYFPAQPINVRQPSSIVVTILNLIPKCIAYWNVVEKEGFAELNDEAKNNFTNSGLTIIKDFEEYFLQELVDYDNNTLSKDVTLSLPSEALKPNVKYKFRLTTICPEPANDVTPQAKPRNVTSYFDIILFTNEPPETFPLTIQPSIGVPMKTKFKFSTGVAKDLAIDFPLKYSFGYIVQNVTVKIGTFYEGTVAHTQLPFAESIETFCDVCDNNEACARVAGPTVAADTSHTFSDNEYEAKLEEFEANLKRAEYDEAINSAVVLILTQQNLNKDSYESSESKMLLMMKNRLQKLKVGAGSFHQQNIIDFVRMAQVLMSLMTVNDDPFVAEVLNLTEEIGRTSRKVKRTTFSANRSPSIVNYDVDYMKTILRLSDTLLSSNNESTVEAAKENFVAKVRSFARSICQNKNLDMQAIDSQFVSLEVLKVHSPQLIAPQKFPGLDETTIRFQKNSIFPSKFVCVAKIEFKIDMFQVNSSTSQPVYETIILDENDNGSYKEVAANQISDVILVDLPGVSSESTCFMLQNGGWSADGCSKQKTNSTGRISCKCKTKLMERVIVKSGQIVKQKAEIVTEMSNGLKTTQWPTPFTVLSTASTGRIQTTLPSTVPLTGSVQLSSSASIKVEQLESTSATITSQTTLKPSVSTGSTRKPPETDAKAPTKIESITNASPGNGTNQNPSNDASVSWTLIILLLAFAGLIVILFSAHRCRQYAASRLSLPMRCPSDGIRYARYHDEFTMQ